MTAIVSRPMSSFAVGAWRALTRNKFGAVIGDTIAREFGITPRHDISDGDGKPQRLEGAATS